MPAAQKYSLSHLLLSLLLLFATPVPLLAAASNQDCKAEDTHLSCGELVVFNDTRSPASTVFRLALPKSLKGSSSSFTLYASTCHTTTTGHTTVKLYDDCPLMEAGGRPLLRPPIASNSRDRNCEVSDRSSGLTYVREKDKKKDKKKKKPKDLFIIVTSGFSGNHNPTESDAYSVGLFLKCRNAKGFEITSTSSLLHNRTNETTASSLLHNRTNETTASSTLHNRTNETTAAMAGAGGASDDDDGGGEDATIHNVRSFSQSVDETGGGDQVAGLRFARVRAPLRNASVQAVVLPAANGDDHKEEDGQGEQNNNHKRGGDQRGGPQPQKQKQQQRRRRPGGDDGSAPRPRSLNDDEEPLLCESRNASCGLIEFGSTAGAVDFAGADAGEAAFSLRVATAREVTINACVEDLADGFRPTLRVYTDCPQRPEMGNSSAEAILVAVSSSSPMASSSPTAPPSFSSSPTAPPSLGFEYADGDDVSGGATSSPSSPPSSQPPPPQGSEAFCATAVLVVEEGEEGTYWIVVDGATDGSEGAFELRVTCSGLNFTPPTLLPTLSEVPTAAPSESLLPTLSEAPTHSAQPSESPTLLPTAQPSEVPSPSPTAVPARTDCSCFSSKMIENLNRHCPSVAHLFVEGCMVNVTRAVLERVSKNCTALKADWGPYFGNPIPGYPSYD